MNKTVTDIIQAEPLLSRSGSSWWSSPMRYGQNLSGNMQGIINGAAGDIAKLFTKDMAAAYIGGFKEAAPGVSPGFTYSIQGLVQSDQKERPDGQKMYALAISDRVGQLWGDMQSVIGKMNLGALSVNDGLAKIKEMIGACMSDMDGIYAREEEYYQAAGQIAGYGRRGMRSYTFEADSGNTCPECAALDGQVFALDEAEVGVNWPPMHPNCGCGVEISSKTKEEAEESKQNGNGYFATDKLIVRDAPDGNKVLTLFKGAPVYIYEPPETQQVAGSDNTWIKVIYDDGNIGWVAKEFLDNLPGPITGYNFKYDWEKSEFVTPEFEDKVVGISERLGIDPDDLMAVMAFESWFDPAKVNSEDGIAKGLIQFRPSSASDLGTTTDDLAKMSGVDQLDYVFGFLYPFIGRMKNLGDVYMAVFAHGDGIGEADDYILYEEGSDGYNENSGLDADNKEYINRGDAVKAVLGRRDWFGAK